MLRNWLTKRRPSLGDSIAEARAAALSASDSARRAAEAAEVAVDLLRELEEHQTDQTPRRYRRLVVACGLLALGIGICSWLTTPAFTDPPPEVTSPGLVQVVVEAASAQSSEGQAALGEVVLESRIDEDDGEAAYSLHLPEALINREFKILLAGSAVLHDLAPIIQDELTIEQDRCQQAEVIPGLYLEGLECQVMTGRVGGDYKSPLQECRDEIRTDLDGDYYEVQFWGKSSAVEDADWAHTMTNMPDLQGVLANDPISKWSGFKFEEEMLTISPTTCRELDLAESRTHHSSSTDPSAQSAQQLRWGPELWSESHSVVSTRRSAAAIGNLLLAGVGVMAAVLIGLVPVTYEAWRSWRRSPLVRD